MKQELSVESLCGGAVREKINRALRRVSENILDPNTSETKKRSLTVTLTFIPQEDDREDVVVEASVVMKLAPEEEVKTLLYINRDPVHDTVTITEHVKGEIKGQLSLDDMGLSMIQATKPVSSSDVTDDRQDVAEETHVIDFRAAKEV